MASVEGQLWVAIEELAEARAEIAALKEESLNRLWTSEQLVAEVARLKADQEAWEQLGAGNIVLRVKAEAEVARLKALINDAQTSTHLAKGWGDAEAEVARLKDELDSYRETGSRLMLRHGEKLEELSALRARLDLAMP